MVFIKKLVWDKWNEDHIARHHVTRKEVKQVFQSDHVVKDAKKGRLLIIGKTKSGKILAVVIDPEPDEGVYYPVTARPADKNERQRFIKEKGGR